MNSRSKHAFEFIGWLIFVASALFFLASTIRSGDILSIVGSVLFLVACIVFMVPLLAAQPMRTKVSRSSIES